MQPSFTQGSIVEFYLNGFWVPAIVMAVRPLANSAFSYTIQPDLTNFPAVGPRGPYNTVPSNLIRLPEATEANAEVIIEDDLSPLTVSPAETEDTAVEAGSPDEAPTSENDDPSQVGSAADPIAPVS